MALDHVKDLLLRALRKENDSSEEKHLSEFFADIVADDSIGYQGKMDLIRSSAEQMKEFCTLVIEKANLPYQHSDGD